MATEINHWIETSAGPREFGGEVLDDMGTLRLKEFGDGRGNEGFVADRGDAVVILSGEMGEPVTGEAGEQEGRFRPQKVFAWLGEGERHEEVFVDADGTVLRVAVRNIGATTIDPSLN